MRMMIVVMMVFTIVLMMTWRVIQFINETNQLSLEPIKTDKFRNQKIPSFLPSSITIANKIWIIGKT